MDSSNSNLQKQTGIYTVRDPKKILKMLFILFLLGGVCYLLILPYIDYVKDSAGDYLLKNVTSTSNMALVGYAMLIFIPLTMGVLLRLRAIWSGVKINLDERFIQIPGGNISPNDVIDFLKPSFLLQHFLRFQINMDEIKQINESTKQTTSSKKIGGGYKTKRRYRLGMSGSFGSANVWFVDEGKRNEIYAAIRELNRMGDPLIHA